MGRQRWLLAAGSVVAFGTTLSSCSYAPEYAVTLNDEGHVQVEWCFDNAATVHVRPDGAVLTASSGGGSRSGPFAVDLETAPADQWSPSGVPEFDDDTVIEVWYGGSTERTVKDSATTTTAVAGSSPTTTAYTPAPRAPELTVRVGDLQEGRYWFDGAQHSPGDWRDQCDTGDDGGLGGLVWLAVGGVACFLIVVGVAVWGIVSAVKRRSYDEL